MKKLIPYNGNSSRKKMFANFANLSVFANIFLLNFHRSDGWSFQAIIICSSWMFNCSVRMFCNDWVSTVAAALALLCRAFTVATFVGKMGVASSDIGTRKLYIREGWAPHANFFSWIRKLCEFANIFFCRLFPLYGTSKRATNLQLH